MPGAARVGQDIAGGLVVGPGSTTVVINGSPASLVGDQVVSHGSPPHTASMIVTGSTSVVIDGKPLAVQGLSIASCQHPMSTGSPTVIVGR